MFQSIPGYQYYSEPEWPDFKNIDFTNTVAIKVPRVAPGTDPSSGLPFDLEQFYNHFPPSGIIFWQVRHPLDTVCSLRVGIAKSWGHHPQPHNYREWLNRPLVEQCAYHWNYINTRGFTRVEEVAKINKFEDMICDPFNVACRQLVLAGVDIDKHRKQIQKWASRVQDVNNAEFVEAHCSRAYSRNDHSRKVGRWRENLSASEVSGIKPIIQPGARNFDYILP
ncbi:MAG: hypothetical protein DHS20C17_32110 [Cyclobacteriaceae bacterium]|nr:MAG: hypothetical protein DHS20C17_32110 [Cyclobacteriaceae bacterium]